MTVRPLRPEDRERWEELWAGYLTFYEEDLPAEITDLTWRRLHDPLVDLHGIVFERDGTIVGFTHYLFHPSTWSRPGYCYLEDLFTDPDMRGGGVGRALIEAVSDAANARGVSRVYWQTQEFNATARALYDKVATLTPFRVYER